MDSIDRTAVTAARDRERSALSAFLEWGRDRVHNPHTNLSVHAGDPAWNVLQQLHRGLPATALSDAVHEQFVRDRWLVDPEEDLARRYLLRIVSLETVTNCNQRCYFCPVSIAPREDVEMPQELLDSIVNQLTDYRTTLEGVFLQSYNEPTLDRRFVPQCHTLFDAGLPVAILTNGSGLSARRVDEILSRGKLRYIAVNLSTLDRDRYAIDRGADHLSTVLRNLDYIAKNPVATEMKIVVLGKGDEVHHADFEAIRKQFAGTPFEVSSHDVMDRAGYLDLGRKPEVPHQRLRGCDNIGSRPIQHLHITPAGRCILCCEDYDEGYVIGDLNTQTIHEVMSGPEIARYRRWSYGLEEAPADYMCRNCIFAKTGDEASDS